MIIIIIIIIKITISETHPVGPQMVPTAFFSAKERLRAGQFYLVLDPTDGAVGDAKGNPSALTLCILG